jgi:hypothetical protein
MGWVAPVMGDLGPADGRFGGQPDHLWQWLILALGALAALALGRLRRRWAH